MTNPNPPSGDSEPEDAAFSWGRAPTRYFYELTPDVIFSAVESFGYRCTGRCLPLNSMENRVVEVEIDVTEPVQSESDRFRVAKFYRPFRWTREQIMEEHRFLKELESSDVPVVVPETAPDGTTLRELPEQEILFCVYPKVGGRNPDELRHDQLERIGRLLARLHIVGSSSDAPSRIHLNPATYGLASLDFLLDSEAIPESLEDRYIDLVEDICETVSPWFEAFRPQRVHGDCHLGNLLWGPSGPFWVDFDDMVMGPPVQDIWLLTPGRDDDARSERETLLTAYQSMSTFDRDSLVLVEPLRALRFIHFSAWIAKRWEDPAFQRTFPEFAMNHYWNEQIHDLKECLSLIRETI